MTRVQTRPWVIPGKQSANDISLIPIVERACEPARCMTSKTLTKQWMAFKKTTAVMTYRTRDEESVHATEALKVKYMASPTPERMPSA